MIELSLKILLVFSMLFISWQDIRDRMVYTLSYVITGIAGFMLHIREVDLMVALTSAAINLVLVTLVILIALGCAYVILKKKFVNESIGSGDLLFFILLAPAFPTMTFTVLFVFSLIFSLVLNTFIGYKDPDKTVPLAGYMAIFYSVVYIASIFIEPVYLFST